MRNRLYLVYFLVLISCTENSKREIYHFENGNVSKECNVIQSQRVCTTYYETGGIKTISRYTGEQQFTFKTFMNEKLIREGDCIKNNCNFLEYEFEKDRISSVGVYRNSKPNRYYFINKDGVKFEEWIYGIREEYLIFDLKKDTIPLYKELVVRFTTERVDSNVSLNLMYNDGSVFELDSIKIDTIIGNYNITRLYNVKVKRKGNFLFK